jgi:hypothetical protein
MNRAYLECRTRYISNRQSVRVEMQQVGRLSEDTQHLKAL